MSAKRRSMAEFLELAESDGPTVLDGLKRDLPVENLVPRQNQPRRLIDPIELERMATTIRALGVIQPIVVRPMGARSADGYEIVAGERRWRAAQLAGISVVPTIIRTLDERSSALYSLAENIARSDLNPMELARGYQSVLQEHDFSQTALAEAIGQNVKTVNRILRLLKLDAPVQELIERGSLTAKHGELLLGAPKPRQVELAQRAAEHQWSVRELENQMAKSIKAVRRETPVCNRDDNIAREQQLWCEQLGAEVKLHYAKAGKVRITITASSLDEYQGIRERLGLG
ncbi:MAG: ParB/RepB/Spo0J family partition protein [Candidatus Competibacter sp.]|nr:ParB/RepB/Spo0J family partition protein [Candidatus Competibacteraceae bacterium]MBK8964169.1 ParB/RepB/Spo0J family partition protein [Candidatus Competibacteraceae bacterium]